jgi:Cu-Zn family superoxide dismutase
MKPHQLITAVVFLSGVSSGAAQADMSAAMTMVDATGAGASVGTISATETAYGVLFTPALTGLPAGVHGFHVHENASCAPKEKDGKPVAALAAGGHLDPEKTGKHEGPYGKGHLGDLPAIVVAADGSAASPVLAPRIKLTDLAGRSLMLHAGGDNHSDHPATLGGGGARIACGVLR